MYAATPLIFALSELGVSRVSRSGVEKAGFQ